jgi:1,4-alpha-glucan branching enzyme
MPECAYRPSGPWKNEASGAESPHRVGTEMFLEEAGFRWTVADAHLLLGGEPFLGYGFPWVDDPHAELPPLPEDDEVPLARQLQPVWIEESEVAAFFREPHTARQVWARQMGYPGDPAYLDFHKRHEDNGLRLWRVTDADADLADKLPYWPADAEEVARRQADHFVFLLEQLPGLAHGVALCPYDAELFGHWWYEGPRWLEETLSLVAAHPRIVTTTPSQELSGIPAGRRARLDEGSWGEGGDHRVWLNEETGWMWRDLERAEAAVAELLRSSPVPGRARAALRQLMLLAASDWPFLLTMGTATDYAIRRFQLHRDRLHTLIAATDRGSLPSWADEDLIGLAVEAGWWSEGDA